MCNISLSGDGHKFTQNVSLNNRQG